MIRTTYYCPVCEAAFSSHWPVANCDCGCFKIHEVMVTEVAGWFSATFVYDEPMVADVSGATRVAAIDALIAQVRS